MARRGKGKRRSKKRGRSGGRLSRMRQLVAGFLFGRPVDEVVSERLQEIKGLVLIGASLWLLVSIISHHAPIDSPEGEAYLGAMCAAANFAWCNRQLLMWLEMH